MSIQNSIDSAVKSMVGAKFVRKVADTVAENTSNIDDIIASTHPVNVETEEKVDSTNIPKNGNILETINGQDYLTDIKTDENGKISMHSEAISSINNANDRAKEKKKVKQMQSENTKSFVERLKDMTTWRPLGKK